MRDINQDIEAVREIALNVQNNLVDRSIRPVVDPERIGGAVSRAFLENTPLCLRIVMCPNWTVDESGRAIAEIPVHTEDNKLIIQEPDTKIVKLLTEEVPELVKGLTSNGINVNLLVILADVLSPDWVHSTKDANEKMLQNRKAIKLLLASSERGNEVFNGQKAKVKVSSQLQLATNTPGYEDRLRQYQLDALTMGTPLNAWFLETVARLQEIGEYADKRGKMSGMEKIWDRARFLSAIYALDGEVVESDLVRSGLATHEKPPVIALGTVATAHADIISKGLNLLRPKDPVATISPFTNSMEHSWLEKGI